MTNTFELVVIVTIAAGIVSPVLAQLRDSGGGSAGYKAELPQRTD